MEKLFFPPKATQCVKKENEIKNQKLVIRPTCKPAPFFMRSVCVQLKSMY